MAHANGFLKALGSVSSLQACDFATMPLAAAALGEDVITEDEFADQFAIFSISLYGHRVKRHLQVLVGWPHSLLRCLDGLEQAQEVVKDFCADRDLFFELMGKGDCGSALGRVRDRHAMKKVSNQQCIEALRETDDVATPQFVEMVKGNAPTIASTQICEDAVNYSKNDKKGMAFKRFRRPEFAMHAVLRCKIIEERHRYTPIPMDKQIQSKSARLSKSCFQPSKAERSMDFSKTASGSQIPDYFSPDAQNNNTPTADLQMLRYAKSLGSLELVEGAELNVMMDCSHRFVFQYVASEGMWYLPAKRFPQSSVVVVACERMSFGGSDIVYFRLDTDSKKPFLRSILRLEDVTVQGIAFQSWASQHLSFLAETGTPLACNGILPVAVGAPMPLYDFACACAFWQLSKTTIIAIARRAGHIIDTKLSLFQVLFQAISEKLKLPENDVLQIIGKRLAAEEIEAGERDRALSLVDVDAALEVLEKDDHKVVQGVVDNMKRGKHEYESFAKDVAEKIKSVQAAAAKAKAKCKAKSWGKQRAI